MVGSVREVFQINSIDDLLIARDDLDEGIAVMFEELDAALDMDILSRDPGSLLPHMSFVESQRNNVVDALAIAMAFEEYSKSSAFRRQRQRGTVTESDLEADKKLLSSGFTCQVKRLEEKVKSVDSRVNLCKKLLGLDSKQ